MAPNKISDLVLYEDVDLRVIIPSSPPPILSETDGDEGLPSPPSTPTRSQESNGKSVTFASPVITRRISASPRQLPVSTSRTPMAICSIVSDSEPAIWTDSNAHEKVLVKAGYDKSSPVPPKLKKRKLNEVVTVESEEAKAAALRAHQAARSRRQSGVPFHRRSVPASTPARTRSPSLAKSKRSTLNVTSTTVNDLERQRKTSSMSAEELVDNLTRIIEVLEKEAILIVAKLGNNPNQLIRVLKSMQDFPRRVQALLGKQYRVHVLVESAIEGRKICRKYRGCVLIFSQTLLPAIEHGVSGSEIATETICETLSIAERVAVSDNAVRIDAFDLISTPKAPLLRISKWMPGSIVAPDDGQHASLNGLTALASFKDTAKSVKDAAHSLATMYPSDSPFDVSSPLNPAQIDVTKEFVIESKNFSRLLAPNPVIYSRLMQMTTKNFQAAYTNFMYDLRNEGVARGRFSGKISFDRFNPPYFSGRVTLLLPSKNHGALILEPLELVSPSIPTSHALYKNKPRPLAACLLALWMEHEKESRERLLWHLAKQNEVISCEEYDLLSFVDGAREANRPIMIARRMTANLASGELGERDEVVHPNYRLTANDIQSLRPLRAPCSSVIDAFLCLLQKKGAIVLSTKFIYNLVTKPTTTMLSWPMPEAQLRTAHNIVIPLHSRSTSHWALAVIRRHDHFIDIFDSLPTMQQFLPIYPSLIRWANSIRGLKTSGEGWSASYRMCERKEICAEQDYGVDAPIFMLGYAYNVVYFSESDGVFPRNICMLRCEIRDAIISKDVVFLSTSNKAAA